MKLKEFIKFLIDIFTRRDPDPEGTRKDMEKLKKVGKVLLALCLVPQVAWGATVYTDLIEGTVYYDSSATSCADVTAGDTASTLQGAITAATTSGNVYTCSSISTAAQIDGVDGTLEMTCNLYLKRGTTLTYPINSGHRMRASKIFSAWGEGEKPIVTVSDPTYSIINGYGTGGYEISYLHLTGAKRAIAQSAATQADYGNRWIHHNTIDYNGAADSMGSAIYFWNGSSGGDVIEYNTISYNTDTPVKLGNDSTFSSTNPIVRYNTFAYNTCVAGTCEGHVVDFPIGSTGLQFYGNELYGNADATNPTYSGYMISIDGTTNVNAYLNYFHDNNIGVFGMSAQLGGASTGHNIYSNRSDNNGFTQDQPTLNYLSAFIFAKNALGAANNFDTDVYNNTIVNHKTPLASYADSGVIDVVSSTADDVISGIRPVNNLVYGHDTAWVSIHKDAGDAAVTVSADYNLYYTDNGGSAGDAIGAHDITSDPLFLSTTDYRLRANSPARHRGSNGRDIGAYQTMEFIDPDENEVIYMPGILGGN